MNIQPNDRYLAQFVERDRSMIGNLFYFACREWVGSKPTPDELVGAVKVRVLALCRQGDSRRRVLEQVSNSLKTERAREFAEYVIVRESLPAEKRAKLRQQQAAHFREKHMASLAVTEKQAALLRSLGCVDMPTDLAAASQKIDELLKLKSSDRAA